MFSPLAFVGTGGRYDAMHLDNKKRDVDEQVINRFYRAFPGLRFMPQPRYYTFEHGNPSPQKVHPITTYIKKYKSLLAKGYTDEKAFNVVHTELTKVFEA